MNYLGFDALEGGDGITTFEAMAASPPVEHPRVLAEAQAVLDWARNRFPRTQGPVEEGGDWDHDLQTVCEAGDWVTVTLSVTGSPSFAEAFREHFAHLIG